jgi:HSP20 family protein
MLWNIDPWRELERMRSDLDGLFGAGGRSVSRSFPLVNVYDSKDDIVVTAELPGYTKDNVGITFTDGILTLWGKRAAPAGSYEMTLVRQERSVGEFEKSLAIPNTIEQEKIAASFKDGILTITLPKAEEAKPKRISIQVG